jgi:hypothetical protein
MYVLLALTAYAFYVQALGGVGAPFVAKEFGLDDAGITGRAWRAATVSTTSRRSTAAWAPLDSSDVQLACNWERNPSSGRAFERGSSPIRGSRRALFS